MAQAGKTKEMDMLNGGLAGKLILFSIPLAASSILQQLFNSVDTAVVGCCGRWSIRRFAGACSSGKLRGFGWNLCESDRRTFGRTECSFGESDRTG